jgi:nucleoside-diphosphate-sugar epimerase
MSREDYSQSPPGGIKHVLITGSNGFIGKQLTERLKREGVRVTCASRASGIDVTASDLPMEGVDHVFHLAGMTFVPDAWADPVECYRVNTLGTLRVLEQCRRSGASMTFVSTYVYGWPAPMPVSEKTAPNPNNPYAFSKLAAEEACQFYASTFGVKVSILRLFNAFGPGQGADFLIPTIARQVVDPACKEVVVADLAPRRDFVHVDDVIEAFMISPRLPAGQPFNVASGRSHSVEDVIRACLSAAGVNKPFRARDQQRVNEISDVVADIAAIEAASGWRPRVAFSDGIKTVVEAVKRAED